MNVDIKKDRNKTLGPVSDLERHLPVEWWKSLFNSLYLKTDGDVVENRAGTREDVNLILEIGQLDPQDNILDLCCGQGRHTIELASRGFLNLTGIDRSRYLIRLAKKRAAEQGYKIKFSEGDARKITTLDNTFDAVLLMGNSFGYFEQKDDDKRVINEIKRALVSGGKIVLDIANGQWLKDHFEPRSWEWIDQNQFVCRERSLSTDKTRIISREVIVHAEKGVIADQFYAERLYDFEGITELLESAGFRGITLQGSVKGLSSRDQDLGMMSNRMLITAIAPVKQIMKAVPTKKEDILVLLGDPRLPDVVKKDGVFNKEDYDTIEKLKGALAKLDEYSFKYLNNHKNLITTLEKLQPSFVFNLCDEGYNNEATLELHIPALLELFNVPYSGGAPACLAMCYNKTITRSIAMGLDVPVPEETFYDPMDQAASLPSTFPAFIKPNFGDSSLGITKNAVVHDAKSLIEYINNLQKTLATTPVLIQEFLCGEEYSVGIVGNPGHYTVLPILVVDYDGLDKKLPKILGYESKWMPDSAYWNSIKYKRAHLDENKERQMIDYSIKLFERTGCRDYARFDFRADSNGVIKLLEVNPNPGWCWDGKLNMMAELHGWTYEELLRNILNAAKARYNNNVNHNNHIKCVEYAECIESTPCVQSIN